MNDVCICSEIVRMKYEIRKCVLRDRFFVIARAKLREKALARSSKKKQKRPVGQS